MMIVRLGLVVSLLLRATGSAAQETSAGVAPDTLNVALAAVEWYAGFDDRLRSQRGTLVISQQTSGFVSSPRFFNGHRDYVLERADRRRFDFDDAAIRRLRERSGIPIAMCDTIKGDSLCGVPQPWVWLVLTTPSIQGDRAIISVEARELIFGPPPLNETARTHADHAAFLVREKGIWKVESVRRGGIH